MWRVDRRCMTSQNERASPSRRSRSLSDVLIDEALREASSRLQRRYGTPEHLDAEGRLVETPFAVLSLGKLGGNELNYSSDVDLMYIFGDGEEAADITIANREYFIRLAQQVTDILSRVTREGPVFRAPSCGRRDPPAQHPRLAGDNAAACRRPRRAARR